MNKAFNTLLKSKKSHKIILAISGGVDSMVLLHSVVSSKIFPLQNITVVHFDHDIRPDSYLDAALVKKTCRNLNISCFIKKWANVPTQGNLEDQARNARYEFMLQVANQVDSDIIITAHHANDQTETFFHNLFRGAGVRGLRGITMERPLNDTVHLFRPLLKFSKSDIVTYAEKHKLSWREDSTNKDIKYTRNKIRNVLIPYLSKLFKFDIVSRISNITESLDRANTALDWMVIELEEKIVIMSSTDKIILSSSIVKLPEEIIVRIVSKHHRILTGKTLLSKKALDQLLHLIHTRRRKWFMNISGAKITRDTDYIVLTRK